MGIFDPVIPVDSNKEPSIFEPVVHIDKGDNYISPNTEGVFSPNGNKDVSNTSDANIELQGMMKNALNSFWQGIDNTDVSMDDYDITGAELKIANNNKVMKGLDKNNPIYSQLEQDNSDQQQKLYKAQENKDSNLKDIKNEPVSKEYQLKESLVSAQGSDAELWNQVAYSYPNMIGSSASLIIPTIVAEFGTETAATLATPYVGEVAAPFVALGGAAAAIAYGRHQETKGEVGSQVQQNKEQLIQQYIDKNGKQPDQDAMDDIIIQANKGRDTLYWENMAESIPDLAGAMLFMPELNMFGKVGKALDEIKDYNKLTRVGTGLGKIGLEYEKEKFEEGSQYAFQQRQQDFALGTGLYKDDSFINNLLTDTEDTLSSMNWSPLGEVRGSGRYAKDPQFQSSEQSGGALAFIMGGFKGIYDVAKDINSYRVANNDLQKDGVFNTDNQYYKLKDSILQKYFENDNLHHLIQGVKGLVDKKNPNGTSILTEQEAASEVGKIKNSYKIYERVDSQVDDIEKKGFLGLFDSKDQVEAKKAIKDSLFHTSLQLERQNEEYNKVELQKSIFNNNINSPELNTYNNLSDLVLKQKELISKLEDFNPLGDKESYNIPERLKQQKSKLSILEKAKSIEADKLKESGIKVKDEPLTLEEQELNKNLLAKSSLLEEQKDNYKKLLNIKDAKSLKEWYDSNIKPKKELKDKVKSTIIKKPAETTATPSDDIKTFADKITKGEDVTSKEDQQFYDNNKDDIESELKSRVSKEDKVADIEKRRKDELEYGNKQLNIKLTSEPLIDENGNIPEVKIPQSLLDYNKKVNAKYDQELDTLNKEESTKTIEDQDIIEDPEYINTEVKDDDATNKESRKSDTVFKTTYGADDGKGDSKTIYFTTTEHLKLDGHKLLVVTKESNPEMYTQILENDLLAKTYEREHTKHKGVWTILVDKDEQPVLVDGKYVQSKLETGEGIKDGRLDVSRGYSESEAEDIKKDALDKIESLRNDILSLKKGDIKYLDITGKSKGVLSDSFESKNNDGSRQSFNVLGRIFGKDTNINGVPLEVITVGNLYNGITVLPGKLYTTSESGRVYDLVPRTINFDEIDTTLQLLEKSMFEKNLDFNPIDEIKKIISFKKNIKDDRFQIYINKDGRLVLGKEEMSPEEFNSEVGATKIIAFLQTKRVNANNKYLSGEVFRKPSLDGNGEVISYKEFLLSGETPMFGTDLKEETNTLGKPSRRFFNTYFKYEGKLNDSNKEISKALVKEESKILEDNTSPVVSEDKTTRALRAERKNKRSDIEFNRLKSISKDNRMLSKEEREWFTSRFPNIPINDIKGLIDSKSLGQFISSGKVLLSSEATRGTLYHEAFHAITQLYLTQEERNKLYKEVGAKSDLEAEEILAEDFAKYKESGNILGNRPVRNTVFRKMLNFIKNLLGLKDSDIQQVYEKLDKGYYTNKKITQTSQFGSLNRDEEVKKLTKDKGTKFIKDVLDSLDVKFFDTLYDKGLSPIAITRNIDKIVDHIYYNFEDLEKTTKDPLLAEKYSYILDNYDTIVKAWKERLNSNGIELSMKDNRELEDLLVNQDEDKSVFSEENRTDWGGSAYQEGNLTSTLESISSPVRMLLMSLKQIDSFGNPITNDLGMESSVDFKSTYNYLLKNLVGVGSSYEDIYNKIDSLIKYKPEFKQLKSIIGEPSSDISDELIRFQTQFTQDFNKNRIDSLITTYSPDGNIRITNANRQNEADKVKTIWEANLADNASQDKDGKLVVDTKILDIKDPLVFLSKLGMIFNENTLEYIGSKDFNSSELNKSIAAIKAYIEYHKGDVTNMLNQTKGESNEDKNVSVAGNRLNYILNLDAKYTSLVNELSFISSDGKTEYSIGENNGLSITTNIINNAKSRDELISKLPQLGALGIESSVWMNELFDSKTGLKNDGVEVKLELHNGINNSEESEERLKNPTRKGTKGDLYSQQITSILNGKSSFIVSADKSQEYVISLNKYDGKNSLPIPIIALKDSFNNIRLKVVFRGYFKSEATRIAKFELDGLGKNTDIYNKNGGKFTIFQDILNTFKNVNGKSIDIRGEFNDLLARIKSEKQSYDDASDEINAFIDSKTSNVDESVIKFFDNYKKQLDNAFKANGITSKAGFPKDFTDKYSLDALTRTIAVTDFINSIEQTKLFLGDMAFYKDLYKRTSMYAGTKQIPRIDKFMNDWLNKRHPRKDGRLADDHENTVVYNDVKVQKRDLEDWIKAYKDAGFSEDKAYETLGYKLDKDGHWTGESAYGNYDEGDAMGWGSLDFIMEFHRRLGTSTSLMEQAYSIVQKQEWNDKGELVKGELLTNDQIALWQTLKLQYTGPINSNTSELFIPGGYKFTVMPLIPQMVAGRNLSKVLDRMTREQNGISLFKSASKFGTQVDKDGKANKFYTGGNHGNINEAPLISQSISYQYLGLQVKPSEPHDEGIFSTQFRKTILINAFSNGEEVIPGAKVMLDEFNKLINDRVKNDKDNLIKDLGINPESKRIEDVTELVKLLTKSSEDRKLPDNIIDSLGVEEVNGIKQLKYSISSMVNKPKIDSMLMSLINSRLIKQKFNGDAYVLAPVSGMEPIGKRHLGSNDTLRPYTQDNSDKTLSTLPAEVMVPLSDTFQPLLDKYKTLEGVNNAIKEGKIDPRVLEMVGCRIPGQGMNSNEYLTIKEFLPKDSATTMIAHSEIVAKAGSDFDNDKLYTYRANINKNGEYIEDNTDNKITSIAKKFISHPSNFLALITPNSTAAISPVVDDIKYTDYVNKKKADGKEFVSPERFKELQKGQSDAIKYTDLLKLNKKVEARHKLWSAKDMVGPTAIANAYGPLSQIGGITANKSYINDDGETIDVSINMPHNEIDGKLNLGAKKDALGVNDISEINSQYINIAVDAAKDEVPMVAHLNMTNETLPIYLYLNKEGVPFEYAAHFMTQPIISDYLEANSVNKSLFLKTTKNHKPFGVKREIRESYGVVYRYSKAGFPYYVPEYKTKDLDLTELTKYKDINNQNGKEYQLFQQQVFDDFLEYKKQAKLFGDAVRVTNADSSGLGQNINAERLKLLDYDKVKKNGFINGVDKIIDNTFIGSFMQGKFSIDTYSPLYDTQHQELVDNIISLANRIEENEYKFKSFSREDKLKLINTIENDFINYVVQNYGYTNIQEVKSKLFKGENSVAKRLLELKNKKESELTPDELKLTKNILIKELFPLIGKAKKGLDYNNIKLYSKRLNTFSSNTLTEAFREVKETDMSLAKDLMDVGILQSGLNNSPITYLGLVPHEYYNNKVKEAFSEYDKKNGAEHIEDFNKLFLANREGKIGYKMYGKDFYNKNIQNKLQDDNNSVILNDKIHPYDELKTWDLGKLEGTPQTKEAQEKVNNTLINHPNEKIEGGESFNEFSSRALGIIKDVIHNSDNNTVVLTHNSVFGLIKLWNKEGRPNELSKEFREKYTKQDSETGDHYTLKSDKGTIYVVRHGETEDNKAGNFRISDVNLTDKGVQQAKQVGKELKDVKIPEVISSSLPRALHTANLLLDEQKGGVKTDNLVKPQPVLAKETTLRDNIKASKYITQTHGDLFVKQQFFAEAMKFLNPYIKDGSVVVEQAKTKTGSLGQKIYKVIVKDSVEKAKDFWTIEQANDIKDEIDHMFDGEQKQELLKDLNNVNTEEDLGKLLEKICKLRGTI